MHANKAPIWRDSQRLLVLTEEAVRRFPRYHKYTLGSDLRHQAMEVCRLVNRAWRDPRGRSRHVAQLVMAVDEFKLLLQLCAARLSRRLKRRVLRLAWWPHQTQLPLWGHSQGV